MRPTFLRHKVVIKQATVLQARQRKFSLTHPPTLRASEAKSSEEVIESPALKSDAAVAKPTETPSAAIQDGVAEPESAGGTMPIPVRPGAFVGVEGAFPTSMEWHEANPDFLVTLREAVKITRRCRSSLYDALKRGDLRAKKSGRRTLFWNSELSRWMATMPDYAPESADHPAK